MEIPTSGQRRTWQRRQLDGSVGKTVYVGIFIPVGQFGILVCDLSHGMRVLEIDDPGSFVFSPNVEPVVLSPADVEPALVMLNADKQFQKDGKPRFLRLINPT